MISGYKLSYIDAAQYCMSEYGGLLAPPLENLELLTKSYSIQAMLTGERTRNYFGKQMT